MEKGKGREEVRGRGKERRGEGRKSRGEEGDEKRERVSGGDEERGTAYPSRSAEHRPGQPSSDN